jgi:hypothetical protein
MARPRREINRKVGDLPYFFSASGGFISRNAATKSGASASRR